MNKKTVGLIILSFAAILGLVVIMYDDALNDIVNTSCEHGLSCPMQKTIETQRNVAFMIIAIVVIAGFGLIYLDWQEDKKNSAEESTVGEKHKGNLPSRDIKKKETANIHIIKEKAKSKLDIKLEGDEKRVYDVIAKKGGSTYQGDLVRDTGFSKVKLSRVLDKLEHAGVLERKRRGMTNLVVLK